MIPRIRPVVFKLGLLTIRFMTFILSLHCYGNMIVRCSGFVRLFLLDILRYFLLELCE